MKFKTVLLLALVLSAKVNGQGPAETIPVFNFLKQDKSSFTNKNLATGKVLFFVFFDTECDHCQRAIADINRNVKEFNKTAVYLLSLDNKEKVNNFLNTFGPSLRGKSNITLLQDVNNEFVRKFRPRKYPSLFLFSSKRELLLYDDNEQNIFRFIQLIKSNSK